MKSSFAILLLICSIGAAQDSGILTRRGDGVYSNEGLRFRYKPSRDLSNRTEPFRAEIQKQAKDSGTSNMLNALLAMSSGIDDGAKNWGSVTIETYPRKSASERDDVKAEIQMSGWVAHATGATTPPKFEVISGQRFAVSLFALQDGKIRKGAVVWTTVRRGKLLSFAFAANSPQRLKSLTESMKSVQFY